MPLWTTIIRILETIESPLSQGTQNPSNFVRQLEFVPLVGDMFLPPKSGVKAKEGLCLRIPEKAFSGLRQTMRETGDCVCRWGGGWIPVSWEITLQKEQDLLFIDSFHALRSPWKLHMHLIGWGGGHCYLFTKLASFSMLEFLLLLS